VIIIGIPSFERHVFHMDMCTFVQTHEGSENEINRKNISGKK